MVRQQEERPGEVRLQPLLSVDDSASRSIEIRG